MIKSSSILLALIVTFITHLTNATAEQADDAVLKKIKRVGVISMAGDTLIDQTIGRTIFGDAHEEYDVSDWKLDDVWEQQLTVAVDKLDMFEVIDISGGREKLVEFYDSDGALNWSNVREEIINISEENDLDAIFILATEVRNLYPSRQSLTRYGIFHDKTPMLRTVTTYYISGSVFLMDGSTGDALATQYLIGGDRRKWGGAPFEVVPEELKKLRYSEYTPQQKEFLKEALIFLVGRSCSPSLEKMLNLKKKKK